MEGFLRKEKWDGSEELVLVSGAIVFWFNTVDVEIINDDDIAIDDDIEDDGDIADDIVIAVDEVLEDDVVIADDNEDADVDVIIDDVASDSSTTSSSMIDDDGKEDDVDTNDFSFESFVSKKLYSVGVDNMPPATLSFVCFAIGLGKESVEIFFFKDGSETLSLRLFPLLFFFRFTSGT